MGKLKLGKKDYVWQHKNITSIQRQHLKFQNWREGERRNIITVVQEEWD